VSGLSAVTNAGGTYIISNIATGSLTARFSANPLSGGAPLGIQFTDQSSETLHTVTATASGFFTYTNRGLTIGRNDTVTLDISMSPALSPGQMRFVLRWASEPRDLDAHLLTDSIGGRVYHIFFGNKGRASDIPFDTLDIDDTNGFGPETITIYRFFPGRYIFYIHHYTGRQGDSLRNSQGVVEIYTDAGLVQTIQVPTSGSGRYWHVCEINGTTRAITLVNQILSSPPSSSPDHSPSLKYTPSQSSSYIPQRITSWLWDFGDGERDTVRNPLHVYRRFGAYSISLTVTTDSGAISTLARQNYITVESAFTVNFSEPSLAGTDQGLSITPPPNSNATSGTLFYRRGGKVQYDSTALTFTGGRFVTTIPANAMTIRGLEYYARLNAIPTAITYPETFPAARPAVFRVPFSSVTSPLMLGQRVFKMVSVPAALPDASPRSVLSDDFGEYNPATWRLFRWNDTSNIEFPRVPHFTPGTAFWLITSTAQQFDIDGGTSMPTDNPFSLTLVPGWNQIGTPFAFDVAWESIANTSRLTPPYAFDGIQYQPNVRVMRPWEGYFVRNDSVNPVTLLIPPVEAVVESAARLSATGEEYCLQLLAQLAGTNLVDTYTHFGFVNNGTSERERRNYPEPPPISEHVQVSIVAQGEKYMVYFKQLPIDGEWWNFEIRSSKQGQVMCALREEGVVPSGFRVHVLDLDNFTSVPTGERSFGVDVEKNAARHFRMLIGTDEYLRNNNGGIPLQPYEYALEQNSPNPFNPTTTIRYQLQRRGLVQLAVYDLLGRLIRTLVNDEQLTGSHSVVWDGTNQSRQRVSSGVYFYRMRSGSYVETKKLMLLR
jgi:PKD repeat protein